MSGGIVDGLSLDPPISSLADATFQLLQMQHWLDAILLIDDTTASDLFSYRLHRLCKNNQRKEVRTVQSDSSKKSFSSFADNSDWNYDDVSRDKYENTFNYDKQSSNKDYHLFDSVWKELLVIQLSKNLYYNEVTNTSSFFCSK